MHAFVEVARTGPVSILLHPLRSAVTVLAVVAVLLPYLVGVGLSRGLEREARIAIGEVTPSRFPDLYVSGSRFGRRVPIPVEAVKQIQGIDGVTDVVRRIVGRVRVGADDVEAVLVGIPQRSIDEYGPDQPDSPVRLIEGRWPTSDGDGQPELVLGTELARRLNLGVGSVIPPLYRSSRGDKTSKVTGIFRSDVSLWQSQLILTTFETAAAIFDQRGFATDLLVHCRTGYSDSVGTRIRQEVSFRSADGATQVRAAVTSREALKTLLPAGLGHREGVFNLHFVIVFAVAILVILVTSGFGLPERRREIGILKATGWQTDEILLRSLVESLLLGLAGAAVSILLAYAWLKWLNGYWIASIFLSGVEAAPSFEVPFELTPVPALLSVLISLMLVMIGSLYSSWRGAVTSPAEAMR